MARHVDVERARRHYTSLLTCSRRSRRKAYAARACASVTRAPAGGHQEASPSGWAPPLDNLRAALEYALTTDPTRGHRLAAAVRHRWARRNTTEGRARLERLLPLHPDRDRYLWRALLTDGRGTPYGLHDIRAAVGPLLVTRGRRLEEGRRLLEEALKSAEELGNHWSIGLAHMFLGLLEIRLRNSPEADSCRRRDRDERAGWWALPRLSA